METQLDLTASLQVHCRDTIRHWKRFVNMLASKRAQEHPDWTRIDWDMINSPFWLYLCRFSSDLDVPGLILTVVVVSSKRAQERPDQTRIDRNSDTIRSICYFDRISVNSGPICMFWGSFWWVRVGGKIPVGYPCYCLCTGTLILRQSPRELRVSV